MKKTKKLLSFTLSILMVFCFLPQSILAEISSVIEIESNDDSENTLFPESTEYIGVIGEVIEKRTQTSKTFRLSNGSFVAAEYGQGIHYYDENGVLNDYDNSLHFVDTDIESSEIVSGYQNVKSDISIKLANNSNSNNLIKVAKDNYQISLHLIGADKAKGLEVYPAIQKKDDDNIESATELNRFSSGAIYKDILPSVDLEYIIHGSAVKENIIIKEKCDTYEYIFELKLKDLEPKILEDGSISLNDADGKKVFIIPKGYMYDANGAASNDVTYTLEHKNGKKYLLTVTGNHEWINNDDRAWPITIDPPIYEGNYLSNEVDDSYVYEGRPNETIQGTNHFMLSGYTSATESLRMRSYIKLNTLPSLSISSVIVGATLNLRQTASGNGWKSYTGTASEIKLAARKVTSAWSESSLCWNNRPTLDSTILDYNTITEDTQSEMFNWDITRAVQEWYTNPDTNYGIAIYPITEYSGTGAFAYAGFYSSENSNALKYDATVPMFKIEYRDTKGLEGQWTYSSHGVSNTATGYINGFNGNLVFVNDSITTEGSIIPITVSHVYNSYLANYNFTYPDSGNSVNAPLTADFSSMLVGKGFKLSLQETLTPVEINDATWYVYNDADGTELYFGEDSDGNYISEDGYKLKIEFSNSQKILSDEYGNEKLFDANGRLIQITDVHGNKKKINYSSGRITSITYTPAGETQSITQLTFSYNSNKTLNKVTNAYNTSDYVEFLYSSTPSGTMSASNTGYLRRVKYSGGKNIEYEYDSEGLITSVADLDTKYKITYTYKNYHGRKRISAITETGNGTIGAKLIYSYDDSLFSVRSAGKNDIINDSDDIINTTLFDNFGRAVCSYSSNYDKSEIYGTSYAEYKKYTEYDKSNHKITTDSVKGKDAQNLILNSSFEVSASWGARTSESQFGVYYHRTNHKMVGTSSMKITSSATADGYGTAYQNCTISEPGTYTFSAYVKTDSVTGVSSSAYGAYIVLDGKESEYIKGTTNTNIQGGWQRVSVTKTFMQGKSCSVELKLKNATGTAYFDCVQLEKNDTPSEYNLVENGGMNLSTGWSKNPNATDNDRGSVISLNGNSSSMVSSTQTIPVNISANTTFMLSGWGKANSARLIKIDNKTRTFQLRAHIEYTDGTHEIKNMNFNPDIKTWQYGSIAVVAKKDIDTIAIGLRYDYNVNTAYFDDIALTIEPTQTYSYDQNGELIKVTDIQGNAESMQYANEIDLKKYTSPLGAIYNYTYHTVGGVNTHKVSSVTRTIDSATQTANYTYDVYGNLKTTTTQASDTDAKISSSTQYAYYGNRVSKTIDSLGSVTNYSYDSVTNLLEYIENAKSHRTSYEYDSRKRLTTVFYDKNKDSEINEYFGESSINYLYTNDRLTGINSDKTEYTLTYDNFGNILSVKAGAKTLASYEYASDNGKLKKLTYGNGDYEEYEYDFLDRLQAVYYNGSAQAKYKIQYDSDGRVYSVIDGNTVHTYEYDSLGRLVRAFEKNQLDNSIIMAVENSFDDYGRAKGSSYVIDGTELSYSLTYKDGTNLVYHEGMPKSNVNSAIFYTYDGFDRVTTKRISLQTLYDYHENYEYYTYTKDGTKYTTPLISKLTLKSVKSTTSNTLFSEEYSYTYDSLGNITTISKNGELIASYSYDGLNRLISEDNRLIRTQTIYSYDNSGNITGKFGNIYSEGENPTLVGSTNTTYTYSSSNWGDLLTNYNGTAITYDGMGNPLNWRNATSLTWEGRKLKSFKTTDGTLTYAYNSDGIRTKKYFSDTAAQATMCHEYILDGTKIIREKFFCLEDSSVSPYTLDFLYDAFGDVTGFIYDNCYYYYQKNIQDDVIRILDRSGNSVTEYTYDSWGKVLSTSGSLASTIGEMNPFRYRSYYYDKETGLYYLNSRYYDPEVGRFLNPDGYVSTGQGLQGYNMFAYCGNNPIMYKDPTGQFFSELWEFTKSVFNEIGNAMSSMAPAYVAAGTTALIDGPLPVTDIAALGEVALLTLTAIAIGFSNAIEAPAISIPKVEEKSEVIPAEPPQNAKTYYHVTTLDNANSIIDSRKMCGSDWEGGYIYAWKMKPSEYAIENSGAHFGVTISFKTNALFSPDLGIFDPNVQKYGPVVSVLPGPIVVWDVKIVG